MATRKRAKPKRTRARKATSRKPRKAKRKLSKRKPARKTRRKSVKRKVRKKKVTRKKTTRRASRRKPARKKPVKRKAKKPVKARKKAVKRAKPQTVKKSAPPLVKSRPKPSRITVGAKPSLPLPLKKPAGKVTHYFTNLGVAVIDLTTKVSEGDRISIEGATTNFMQTVSSMQVDHKIVAIAKKGDSIGLKVLYRVRPGDVVYKI